MLTSSTLTEKQVISRRRKNENVFKVSKDEKCTCKACKNTVFHCQICKFVGFLLPSSSWLLKLPYENFTSSFGRLRQNIAPKIKRATRAARLFFFIQPIKSLICGGVVDVAVVKSLTL